MKAEDIVQMARDAARYRFMRDFMTTSTLNHMIALVPEWDGFVDDEIAQCASVKEQE